MAEINQHLSYVRSCIFCRSLYYLQSIRYYHLRRQPNIELALGIHLHSTGLPRVSRLPNTDITLSDQSTYLPCDRIRLFSSTEKSLSKYTRTFFRPISMNNSFYLLWVECRNVFVALSIIFYILALSLLSHNHLCNTCSNLRRADGDPFFPFNHLSTTRREYYCII